MSCRWLPMRNGVPLVPMGQASAMRGALRSGLFSPCVRTSAASPSAVHARPPLVHVCTALTLSVRDSPPRAPSARWPATSPQPAARRLRQHGARRRHTGTGLRHGDRPRARVCRATHMHGERPRVGASRRVHVRGVLLRARRRVAELPRERRRARARRSGRRRRREAHRDRRRARRRRGRGSLHAARRRAPTQADTLIEPALSHRRYQ